ncbi:MAG: right-handed parallel beta-helix repeat-containing protein [Thermoplasmata archaeon]|nr:right-handed parallel beta-helix repeat-containing protein [Thermoplasmata archaeon]
MFQRRVVRAVVVTLVVFVSLFATITTLPKTARATTYFVGGVGPGNQTTIQGAVNMAGFDDTVYVYGGIYRENLIVGKSLHLIGENSATTIIDGQNTQDAIRIGSDSVEVTGFTITNGGTGVEIMSYDNCVISANVITNGGVGIYLSDTVGTIVKDNVITSNSGDGIRIYTSGGALIENNSVSSNIVEGIYLSSSVGNTIKDNFASSNERGIYLRSSSNNVIIGNTAWSNDDGSYPYGAGILLVSSSGNRIEDNNASSNYRYGIRLESSASNIIVGNMVSANSRGINLESASSNVIEDNRVILNGGDGIYLDSSSSNTIVQNSISSNSNGIDLYSSGNNTIIGNSISSNRYRGLELSLSDSNSIYHNNIVGNGYQATDNGANEWDDGYPSGGNYWSDNMDADQFSGPNQDQPGSDGIGDKLYYISPGTSVDHYPKVIPNAVPQSPPSQPQNLQATPGDARVDLTWTPPAYDGGSPILNYRIYRRINQESEEFLIQIGNVVAFTDTGLTNGDNCRYWVSARNLVGEGLKSEVTETTPATVPSPPLGLAAVAESRLVTLTWMPPSDTGGSPVTNFKIYRGVSSGGESLLAEVGYVQQYVDIGLANGVTYYYRITAKNEVGEGVMSEEVAATPAAILTVPGQPTRLVASTGDREVTLTWAPPADNGGSPIANYSVYRGPFSGGEAFLVEIGDELTYTDSGLMNGRTYSYRVTAKNAIGEGSRSDSISAVPMVVPGPPIALAVEEGDGRITLRWMPPIDDGGSPVTHYSVYRGSSSGGETYLTTPGDILNYVNTGLTNGETYYYQVTASNAVGEGERSTEVGAVPSVTPPNQAPSCTFTAPSSGETIKDRFAVLGTASDPDGTIEYVEIRIDNGGWTRALGTTSWSYDLDTTVFSDGGHTIYARSFDGTEYSGLDAQTVTIRNPGELPPDISVFEETWFWAVLIMGIIVAIVLLLYLKEKMKPEKSAMRGNSEEESPEGPEEKGRVRPPVKPTTE